MPSLAEMGTRLSEELTLARNDIAALILPYNDLLRPTDFLERVAEIRKRKALYRAGKNPNKKAIKDALNYVSENDLVPIVKGYIQERIDYNSGKKSEYREELDILQKKEKLSGREKSNVKGLEYLIDLHSRLQTNDQNLLRTLRKHGPKAFAAYQEKLELQVLEYTLQIYGFPFWV